MSDIASQILGAPAAQAETASEQSAPVEGQAQPTPGLDVIAKMERRLKMKEQEFSQREQQFQEMQRKLAEYEPMMGELEKNPFAVLGKKGWDLEKLNKHALETMGDDELDPVARRLKQIEDTFAAKDKEWETKLQEAIKAKEEEFSKRDQEYQVQIFKKNLAAHIAQNKDKYEFVATHPDGQELVYDVIFTDLQRRAEAGEPADQLAPMDLDAAAEKVEAWLDAEASKYLSLNKVKSRFGGEGVDWASALSKSEAPKTISNAIRPQSSINPAQLSEAERIQLAVEGLKTGKWASI